MAIRLTALPESAVRHADRTQVDDTVRLSFRFAKMDIMVFLSATIVTPGAVRERYVYSCE